MTNILEKKNLHKILGYLAVFPFVIIIFLCLFNKNSHTEYIRFTSLYLYIIVSFIAASYWGIALTIKHEKNSLTIFSVIPSILITFLLWFDLNLYFNLIVGVIFINIIFFYENIFLKDYIPTWYKKLRKVLNFLVSSLVFVIILITSNYWDLF